VASLENLQPNPERARQDHIGGEAVGDGQRNNPRQPLVGKVEEDKCDQINGENAEPKHEQAPNEKDKKPHGSELVPALFESQDKPGSRRTPPMV
jgi:hypothetical protein